MSENHTRSMPPLSVRAVAGTTLVELRGEIDLFAASHLAAHLDALPSDLVLDLRGVSFVDCSGLGVLCRTRNRILARQGRLRLVTDSARFLRVLRIAGLAGVFEIHPGLPTPLEAEAMSVTAG
ncbi:MULTISPECIES: STAS domain-containing protein [unclassified Streptomyces]|uniref:STAS domain-containing protein n=1 Tax=unclassified Streptomyces TaxID=2593676 RepID=UPI0023662F59|nr:MULTISPECIES: STAS domain-containing protein [unclassified Streptomyces]MDF3146798.1 STAS domain-containing protein [Streptomyces sp. T21Q-yed]WDF43924.1 STAS domain-containing protein [Streptomyces sp. T12]